MHSYGYKKLKIPSDYKSVYEVLLKPDARYKSVYDAMFPSNVEGWHADRRDGVC